MTIYEEIQAGIVERKRLIAERREIVEQMTGWQKIDGKTLWERRSKDGLCA